MSFGANLRMFLGREMKELFLVGWIFVRKHEKWMTWYWCGWSVELLWRCRRVKMIFSSIVCSGCSHFCKPCLILARSASYIQITEEPRVTKTNNIAALMHLNRQSRCAKMRCRSFQFEQVIIAVMELDTVAQIIAAFVYIVQNVEILDDVVILWNWNDVGVRWSCCIF